MKLVLEGGGSRAAFSAGVLLTLEQAEIPCEAVVGSSTSAINAAYFAAGQMQTCARVWTEVVPDDFVSYRRLLTPWEKVSAIDVDRMVDDVFRRGWSKLDVERALGGRTALYVAATEVPSGDPCVTRPTRETLFEWLRASTALPVGYNRIVPVRGRNYVDGGLSAPVPFDAAIETETEAPTVVVLTRGLSKAKRQPQWWERAFLRAIVPPDIRETALRQHDLYNAVVTKLKAERDAGRLILIAPPADMTLGRLERDQRMLQRGIDIGRRVGDELLAQLEAS